jgi:hypothetical protein
MDQQRVSCPPTEFRRNITEERPDLCQRVLLSLPFDDKASQMIKLENQEEEQRRAKQEDTDGKVIEEGQQKASGRYTEESATRSAQASWPP